MVLILSILRLLVLESLVLKNEVLLYWHVVFESVLLGECIVLFIGELIAR